MELTPTGWSILGFLSLQDRNGYEIRQAARRSVEQFWGVSDGQLYPQLRPDSCTAAHKCWTRPGQLIAASQQPNLSEVGSGS